MARTSVVAPPDLITAVHPAIWLSGLSRSTPLHNAIFRVSDDWAKTESLPTATTKIADASRQLASSLAPMRLIARGSSFLTRFSGRRDLVSAADTGNGGAPQVKTGNEHDFGSQPSINSLGR